MGSSSKKHQKKAKGTAQQPAITSAAQPLLKKPGDHVGKQIEVPGSFWQGRQSAEEKNTLYKCTIREYKALHTYHDKSVGQGIDQEMGVRAARAASSRAMRLARSSS